VVGHRLPDINLEKPALEPRHRLESGDREMPSPPRFSSSTVLRTIRPSRLVLGRARPDKCTIGPNEGLEQICGGWLARPGKCVQHPTRERQRLTLDSSGRRRRVVR
jgi:hypothetical protein